MDTKKVIIILLWVIFCVCAYAQECVECHKEVTPQIVGDWQLSKHSQNEINCSLCHGDAHKDPYDVANVQIPTPDTCANCHDERVEQFKAGKHAAAWAAMKAMPTAHWQPMAMMEGMKGCGGCHKIGLKTEQDPPRDCGCTHLSDMPYAVREPRRPHRLGFLSRKASHARR